MAYIVKRKIRKYMTEEEILEREKINKYKKKMRMQKYYKSEHGKQKRRECRLRYIQSERGKLVIQNINRKRKVNGNNKINCRISRLRRYGLSNEEYDKLLSSQNGACAVCGGKNHNGIRLAVDHCHETGKVRGLLCSNCNIAIGGAKDNVYIIMKMLEYGLERF